MAIEKGNVNAMNNFGYYYNHTEINYDEMKKYYLMAIEKGCAIAMGNLGCYYNYTEINYNEMKKYYLMAIEKGCVDSMNSLANYYEETEHNNMKALEYYIMSKKSDDIERLQKIVFDEIMDDITTLKYITTTEDNECSICYEKKKMMINFKCEERYNHYYCLKCCKTWYEEHDLKCVICTNNINMMNVVLEIK